jgi:molybdate/tungstate transport system permease protein
MPDNRITGTGKEVLAMNRAKLEPFHLVCTALGGVLLLFVLAPLLSLILHTSFQELAATTQEPEVVESIWLTLSLSMAAALLFAIPAVPFAYLLARTNFPLKRLVNGIIDLPIVLPHSAAGIALLGILSRNTFLGKAAESMGFSFVSSPPGIMLAMAFVSLPFLINAARDGFRAVPERLERVALNLGASPARVFFTVSVPLAWRAILSGLIMMWARGLSEFGAVIVIAYHPMVTPVLIYERFTAFGLRHARPVAAVFIAVCLVLFILFRLLARDRQHATR